MNGLHSLKRSWFYIPASKSDWFEKARSFGADVLVFDLEDAVPSPKQKEAARKNILELPENDFAGHTVAVRVNALDSDYFKEDLHCLLERKALIDYVVVPKITCREDVRAAQAFFPENSFGIVPIIELLIAEHNAFEIASAPGDIEFLQWGEGGDYNADWGGELMGRLDAEHDLVAQQFALNTVKAGKIHQKQVLDGTHFNYLDTDGLATRVQWAKRFGFSGKAAMHPVQIPVINKGFTPSPQEISQAEEIVHTFEEKILGESVPTAVPYKSSFISEPQYKLAKKFLARYLPLKELIKEAQRE